MGLAISGYLNLVFPFVQQGNSWEGLQGFPAIAVQKSRFSVVGNEVMWAKIIAKQIFNDDTRILMSCLIYADISINDEMMGDLFELYDRKGFDGMEVVNVQIHGDESVFNTTDV